MKKFISLICGLVILLSLTGCAKKSENVKQGINSESKLTAQSSKIVESSSSVVPTSIPQTSSEAPSSSSKISSVASKTSSKTVKPHTHKYYLPRSPEMFVGDGKWHGEGARPEGQYGIMYPTCTEQGYTVHVCSICNHVLKDSYVPATGHDMSAKGEVRSKFGKEGYAYIACANCGKTSHKTEIYPAHKGSISSLGAEVEFSAGHHFDSYKYKGKGGSITINDVRTYDCKIPTITIDYNKKQMLIKCDLKDGSIANYSITLPKYLKTGEEYPNVFYYGALTENGSLSGNYSYYAN